MNLLRRHGSNHSQARNLSIIRRTVQPLNGSISGLANIPILRQVSEVRCGLHCWKETHIWWIVHLSLVLGSTFAGSEYTFPLLSPRV